MSLRFENYVLKVSGLSPKGFGAKSLRYLINILAPKDNWLGFGAKFLRLRSCPNGLGCKFNRFYR